MIPAKARYCGSAVRRNSCDLKLITRKETGVKIRDQIKMLFVNGEEIDIILIEIFNFSFQLSKAWKES